jgi:hypothetical protein
MKQLIEDYQRRLGTTEKMIKEFKLKNSGSINDIKKGERLDTKASEYRSIIAELEREVRNSPVNINLFKILFDECETVMDVIKLIPQQGQVQYDLTKQLLELRIAAKKLGLYDAVDFLKSIININSNENKL